MKTSRASYKPYPSGIGDEEWVFVDPYLTFSRLDGKNRKHDLCTVFDGLRRLFRSSA